MSAVLDVAEPLGANVVLGFAHTEESYEAANENFEGRASPNELAQRSRVVRDALERFAGTGVSC